jgi:outer membrane protein OmpA-like peptidoglycan-associated protein/cytochrome c-type biogenesis protein CcmH/NrfG
LVYKAGVMKSILSFLVLSLVVLQGMTAVCQSGFSSRSGAALRAMGRAVEAYQSGDNELALSEAQRAIRRDPDFLEAHLLKAEIFSGTGRYAESAGAYREVVRLDPMAYPQAHYFLGYSLLRTGQYMEARQSFLDFLRISETSLSLRKLSESHLAQCEFAIRAMEDPVPFQPENLGRGVNSRHAEYSPALTIDGNTLVFTRRRPSDAARTIGPETEDFYISHREGGNWGTAANLGPPINTSANEGAQSVSADGRELFFTACGRPGGVGSCDLYHSRLVDGQWGEPVNLGIPVNSEAWDSHPSISADGKTLYFSSGRQGSIGSMDIWKTEWEAGHGWGEPVNMGPVINTVGREMSPFIHPDGQTLYFASDGHMGMGGLDLFFSRRDGEGNWSEPVNLGYPINTHADEFSLIVDARGLRAYFASDIEGGYGDLDLYEFELYEEARPTPVAAITGLATGTGEEGGPEPLTIIAEGEPVVLRNIFFDTDSHALKPESMAEISQLSELLRENQGWTVEISGHTDNVGPHAYNLVLSENRARSVVDALTDLGIDPDRMSYKGYADTRPVDTNETAEGRANNRRTEFTVVRF